MMAARARWAWGLLGGGVAAAVAALVWHGRPAAPGGHAAFAVTVVPADAESLDCAAAGPGVGGEICALDEHERPTAQPRPLRPFVSTDGDLLLLANVFEQASVTAWLREARAAGSTARVTLECRGVYVGLSGPVRVRFGSIGAWEETRDVPVGRIDHCRVRAQP